MGGVVTDDNEARLPIPKNYGVDEFPIILQDRTFHDNQLDYRADYDPMGVFGEVPLINGVIRPYVDVPKRSACSSWAVLTAENGACTLKTT